jgi:hypothetical protein
VFKTRSGRTISRATPARTRANRIERPPKQKKTRPIKTDKAKGPKLTAPLSILTKDLHHIPVRDMNAWVNRSVAVRIKEVEDRKGKIPRPMNSFMLYRSAYAERTKAWCDQNNHQVVSSVSGESWPMEPKEVRDMFNDFAKIERMNHQKAYPNYKFTPAKPGTPSRRRKSESPADEDSTHRINLDEPDAEWLPTDHGRDQKTLAGVRPTAFPPSGNFAAESFTMKPAPNVPRLFSPSFPEATDSISQHHGNPYYHMAAQQPSRMPPAEPTHFHGIYTAAHELTGMPGGLHRNLFHDPGGSHDLQSEHQIDPTLLDYPTAVSLGLATPGMAQQFPFAQGEQDFGNVEIGREIMLNYQNPFHLEPWQGQHQVNPSHESESTESEFNKWHD